MNNDKKINYYISVSDIATLTDINPYQDSDECLRKYKKRFSIGEVKKEIKEEILEKEFNRRLKTSGVKIDEYFKKLDVSNSNEVSKKLEEVLVQVAPPASVPIPESEMKSYIKSTVYKQHGKKFEEKTFDWLKTQLHGDLSESQKGKGKNIGEVDGVPWRIYGKVDGIYKNTLGKKFIIEIKNRQNRLFAKIPLYEQVQIQMYMGIFEIKDAILVQQYAGDHALTYFKQDPLFIKRTLSDLKGALKRISSV